MLLTVGNARYNQRKDSCRSPASGGLLQLFSAASRTGLWSRVHQLVGRARCRSRRQVPAPAFLHPCDVPYHPRHLVTPETWSGGAKTRTRPAQLSISRPRRPGHSAGALGVVDALASKATAHGEAAHHALSGCRSAEPPACHLGAQHHPRRSPPVKRRTAHPI